jgi:hypothetical protein
VKTAPANSVYRQYDAPDERQENVTMKRLRGNTLAKLSLFSITLTVVITAIHHVYRLGPGPLVPVAIALVLLFAAMRWFDATGSKWALAGYGTLNVLIFLWFGVIDGFLDHVLKALGLGNLTILPGGEEEVVPTAYSLWSPEASYVFYEGTGILTFVVGLFAMYYGFRFIKAQSHPESSLGLAIP